RPEPPDALIIVPCAQIVQPQRRVELLAGEAVVIRRGGAAGDQGAEGVVVISVGFRPGSVAEEAHTAQPIIPVDAWHPGATGPTVLTDQRMAVGVGALH